MPQVFFFYHTQDDNFKFQPFAYKFHEVIVFNSLVLHCIMYHIFSTHSSVEGDMGIVQLQLIINKTAINMVGHVTLLHIEASLGYMHHGRYSWVLRLKYFQNSQKLPDWHPKWFCQVSFPPSVEECSSLTTPLLASAVTWVFFLSHSAWDGGILGSFWFSFPWLLGMVNISLTTSKTFKIPQLRLLCLALYLIH